LTGDAGAACPGRESIRREHSTCISGQIVFFLRRSTGINSTSREKILIHFLYVLGFTLKSEEWGVMIHSAHDSIRYTILGSRFNIITIF
jgi:hypothetical protein